MADNNSSKPIPDRWTFVVKKQKDGSSLSYFYCPESGQKFSTHDDLMRYVNYAQAAQLSIYAPDFIPRKTAGKSKKKASTSDLEETEKSSDSEDSTFKLPPIEPLEMLDEMSSAMPEKQPASGKNKLEKKKKKKKHGSNEGSSSNKGKAKKQKK